MTREEASSVAAMVLNGWTRPEWTEGQVEMFANALAPYDAEIAVTALAHAYERIDFRPTFAQFVGYYRSTKAELLRAQREAEAARIVAQPRPAREIASSGGRKLPPWVKEWFCARYAYERFGRSQDMRRFVEQQDWADPDLSLMPHGEWAKEAAALSDTQVRRGIANVVFPEH